MKRHVMTGIAASAALMLGGMANAEAPATGPDDYLADARLGEKVDRICFRDQITDFREGTESTVIVERGVKDYLVQTEEACDELDGAQSVSLDGTYAGGRCVTTRDRIAASQSYSGSDASNAGYLCRIKAIYEWNEDALQTDVASID